MTKDTLVVTSYNAPHAEVWRCAYQDLPAKMQAEHLKPEIPWLYN